MRTTIVSTFEHRYPIRTVLCLLRCLYRFCLGEISISNAMWSHLDFLVFQILPDMIRVRHSYSSSLLGVSSPWCMFQITTPAPGKTATFQLRVILNYFRCTRGSSGREQKLHSDSMHFHSMVDPFKCASRIFSTRGCRFMDAHCQPLVTFLSYLCLPLCRNSQVLKEHVESSGTWSPNDRGI